MRAHARIETALRGGKTVLAVLHSRPPICLRATPEGVYWVGGAAGPLGGDELRLSVDVAPGTTLAVRCAAATVALRGTGAPSTVTVRARVGEDATLWWEPEPVVSAAGSVHRADAALDVHPRAAVLWREEVVRGRTGESGGDYRGRLRVDRDGAPLLRHELRFGPAWTDSAAVLDGARAAGSVFRCGPDVAALTSVLPREPAAVLALDPEALLVTALAPDALTLRARLERLTAPDPCRSVPS